MRHFNHDSTLTRITGVLGGVLHQPDWNASTAEEILTRKTKKKTITQNNESRIFLKFTILKPRMPRVRNFLSHSKTAPVVIWLLSAVIFYCFFQMALRNSTTPAHDSSGNFLSFVNWFLYLKTFHFWVLKFHPYFEFFPQIDWVFVSHLAL